MVKLGKQAGEGRNRARAGRTGQGVCAGKLAGGDRWRRYPTSEVKQGAAPECELPDEARQNKNLN